MNLIEITDSRFIEISNLVISSSSDISTYDVGSFELDSPESSSNLPTNFSACELTDLDFSTLDIKIKTSNLIESSSTSDMFCNLAVYYPSGSYIGWHSNGNVNYYNAICTFSDGDSYFEYISGSTHRVNDLNGWYVKKTEWDSSDKTVHRAVSNCNRITITFSSKNESDIDNFINQITE
jgi:hypothetical protein